MCGNGPDDIIFRNGLRKIQRLVRLFLGAQQGMWFDVQAFEKLSDLIGIQRMLQVFHNLRFNPAIAKQGQRLAALGAFRVVVNRPLHFQ